MTAERRRSRAARRLQGMARHVVPAASAAGPFRRCLIANRGEIAIRTLRRPHTQQQRAPVLACPHTAAPALRRPATTLTRPALRAGIARAAGGIGIDSVAVYTQPDALSLHCTAATEAVEIGDPTAADPVAAYLDVSALIDVAVQTGADCVHPGYGFVSENSDFAEQCAANGITFVGPPSPALKLFGDKVAARALAIEVGVPVVPGSADALTSAEDAAATIAAVPGLDYPVMLKASAGGGGRGMRVVEAEGDLADGFDTCSREALAAFGDGSVFVEKFVRAAALPPRLFADP